MRRKQRNGTVAQWARKLPVVTVLRYESTSQLGRTLMSEHPAMDRGELRELDSTQTVRAINLSELYDSHAPRWYAIQLVVSERPVNLDLMPRLEVFAAHRLYAVAGEERNATRYALRLGFFSDEARDGEYRAGDGSRPHGTVQVRTDTNILVGSGDVIVESVQ